MVSAAEELGNRTNRLRLPPNWARYGVYSMTTAGSVVAIKHKFLDKVVTLDAALEDGIEDVSKLEISRKLSENGAQLVSPNGTFKIFWLSSLLRVRRSTSPSEAWRRVLWHWVMAHWSLLRSR